MEKHNGFCQVFSIEKHMVFVKLFRASLLCAGCGLGACHLRHSADVNRLRETYIISPWEAKPLGFRV